MDWDFRFRWRRVWQGFSAISAGMERTASTSKSDRISSFSTILRIFAPLGPFLFPGTRWGHLFSFGKGRFWGDSCPAPSGSWWRADHPTSAVVQLRDGEWHSVLVYRIVDNGEVEGDADPPPQTGCYVEEVLSPGEAIPTWSF